MVQSTDSSPHIVRFTQFFGSYWMRYFTVSAPVATATARLPQPSKSKEVVGFDSFLISILYMLLNAPPILANYRSLTKKRLAFSRSPPQSSVASPHELLEATKPKEAATKSEINATNPKVQSSSALIKPSTSYLSSSKNNLPMY